MKNYDETNNPNFWANREARLRTEAKENSDYANSILGRKEAARKLVGYLGTEKMDRHLTPAEEQQLAEARELAYGK